jgi:hypothetical protein
MRLNHWKQRKIKWIGHYYLQIQIKLNHQRKINWDLLFLKTENKIN